MSDFVKSLLAKEILNKPAGGLLDQIHQVAADDLSIRLEKTVNGVINFASEMLDCEARRVVDGSEVITRENDVRGSDLDRRILVLESSSQCFQKLHISLASPHLVVQNAEKAIAGFEETLDSIGVVKVARGWNLNLFGFQEIGLALEE